ncbi:hypothetical protein BGX38DRAFT_1099131 [Terfezia claveryi]|nr:hypothetical protein BGX38DRAFT_1099131 [Terfezia claveryi]
MPLPRFVVEAGGLVALADLTTIAERTALMGKAWWLDILVIAPGIHLHQRSAELANAGGELPPTAALTSGYVFRVENQAMVGWLQRVGEAGSLVEVEVRAHNGSSLLDGELPAGLIYFLAPILTVAAEIVLAYYSEWWTFVIIWVLIVARAINVAIIRRRSETNWKGGLEPGVDGDLLILVSQDRWIRMKGLVDDIKAVTSGQWLQDMTSIESFAAAGATLLVYVTAALSANSTTFGNIMLMVLLFVEVGLLGVSNKLLRNLHLHERVVSVTAGPKRYNRRLDLAQELIGETGRRDWAVGLGLVKPDLTSDAPSKVVL